jgi:hypothetical protein
MSSRWPAQGALATCTGKAGRCGFGRVLEGFGRGDGVLWVGAGEATTVGVVQGEEGQRGGGPGGVFLLLPCRTAWVGVEGAGLDRGGLHEHGYRIKTNGNRIVHSSSDILDSCPPGARHNARKKSKFEFLKIFTLGGLHIRQGFQRYFCSEQLSCFAKICI